MLRRYALVLSLLCPILFAAPTAAEARSGSLNAAEERTLRAINTERKRHGLRAVRHARPITRTCRSYAQRMIKHNRWGHARGVRVKGFRGIAEILGRAPARTRTSAIVKSWLESPVHRRVLLGKRYRSVGIGVKTGRMGGRPTTVWVVRFAR